MRKKVKHLSASEKKRKRLERKFKTDIRTVFRNTGFSHIPSRNKNIEFQGQRSEIDSLFLYENLLVVSEDTAATSGLRDHVHKTGIFFGHLKDNEEEFLNFALAEYSQLKEKLAGAYQPSEMKVRYLYASMHDVNPRYLESHPHLRHLALPPLRYFLALTKSIKRSARYELLKFLQVELGDLKMSPGEPAKDYACFVLPENPSGFPKGFKVVTFYIDPGSLLKVGYVFRKDSWQDTESLYQRMLIKNKLKSMREYLATQRRTFVNNVIVALPAETAFKDKNGRAVNAHEITSTGRHSVTIPFSFNSVGIIDGQHRVYSYHEGEDRFEHAISLKRGRQQLLVTGIVFPEEFLEEERKRFEAKLFLEVNDKQTRTKGDLRQAIQEMVEPFTPVAIAKSVLSKLAREGPLAGLLEDHYFGVGKIKTTSIVSYALRPLVNPGFEIENSLYRIWPDNAEPLGEDSGRRTQYVEFCASEINLFLAAFKDNLNPDLWTPVLKKSRALSITSINGLLYCLQLLIEGQNTGDFEHYKRGLQQTQVDYTPAAFGYKSSHWRALGTALKRGFS